MHQDSTSSPVTASPEVQSVAESEVGGEMLTAEGGFGFPVDSSFLNGATLTRSKVATLQRIVGNQATQRIIQRELASRKANKAKSVIQRDLVTEENNVAYGPITLMEHRKSAFNKPQEEDPKANIYKLGTPKLDFKTITLEEFKKNLILQKLVFQLAGKTADNQSDKASAIIGGNGIKNADVSTMKKRPDFKEFVAGVIQKCEQKPYDNLGKMDDMARGRFDVSNPADALKVVNGLKALPYKELVDPRKTPDGITNYPRYHIIMIDDTGMTFEWQVGAKATTFAYEEKGIVIPPAFKAAVVAGGKKIGALSNLHDINYAVFGNLVKSKEPKVMAAVQKFGVKAFSNEVALLLQKSGELGESNPDFASEVSGLLVKASKLLSDLVEEGITNEMVHFLH